MIGEAAASFIPDFTGRLDARGIDTGERATARKITDEAITTAFTGLTVAFTCPDW